MNSKRIFTKILVIISFTILSLGAQDSTPQNSSVTPKDKELEQSLEDYLKEYWDTTLDFEKKDLYNYFLAVFLRVIQEQDTFERDLKVAIKYFKNQQNLKDKERVDISKIVFYSDETIKQKKEKVSLFYEAFAKEVPGFAKSMTKELFVHFDKLELDKIRYVTQKGVLQKTLKYDKDEELLELYCRVLLAKGQFQNCFDILKENRALINPQTFNSLQIEAFLYEGEIKLAKTLLDSEEADFLCKKKPISDYDYKMRRNVAIFYRIAGEFKKSLDCLAPLEKAPTHAFYYYYEGMKASRSLDKNTTNFLFKRAARLANRKASKFLNYLLDWEEIKNDYYQEKFSMSGLNEFMNTAEYQKFRPMLVAADNLKQNMRRKGDELIKQPKHKYLELLDIYWLVTLKTIEINRRKKKK